MGILDRAFENVDILNYGFKNMAFNMALIPIVKYIILHVY